MKKDQGSKRRLLTDPLHSLLNIKEVMDTILREAADLPPEVRQALIQARDATWKAFVESQEKDSVQ
jgi:hypothetical protein